VFSRSLIAVAVGSWIAPAWAQDAPLQEVMVQSGRLVQKQFDAPASITTVDAETLRNSGPQVNLSDALNRVPGVVSLNRNNYAQDVQISIRGFGARAAFGLRGIRLITDGIPATIPDGQGQASTVSLTSTERIEVLTGPLAQLYGNASGGVIQTFTREAGDTPQARTQWFVGSYGMQRTDWQLSTRSGQVGVVADYSTFGIQGYRDNSDARRQQLNSVITLDAQPGTRVKWIVNVFDMPTAKDPLGLTSAQLATPNIAGTNAISNGARKTVRQEQLGMVLEHRVQPDQTLTARVYTGTRDNLQYQASSTSATTGTWVGLSRQFNGLGLQLSGKGRWAADGLVDYVIGFDQDHSAERRQGGATNLGQKSGAPFTRNEVNEADNRDYFAQANWHVGDRWTLVSGVRRSQVTLQSRDDYLSDGSDGSGQVRYTSTQPVWGITWHASDVWNLYLNQGKGFETPTLAEAAYSKSGNNVVGLFNPSLLAAGSRHLELGSKWAASPHTRLDLAWFQIKTDNEIVAVLSQSGKTAYANASETLREGLELSARHQLAPTWRVMSSVTAMKATYTQAFGAVAAGNSLPAIPARQVFGTLQWAQRGFVPSERPQPGRSLSLDWVARSRLWADDANTTAAAGYGLFHARARQRFLVGPGHVDAFVGVDNLGNRQTLGSVIVNQSSGQYFEPSLPRSWVIGLQSQMPL